VGRRRTCTGRQVHCEHTVSEMMTGPTGQHAGRHGGAHDAEAAEAVHAEARVHHGGAGLHGAHAARARRGVRGGAHLKAVLHVGQRARPRRQGLTLVHFSAQPEPFLTHKHATPALILPDTP